MNIGIIGTAGRGADYNYLSREFYFNMLVQASNVVGGFMDDRKKEKITLISGGAAVADHIAVMMFLANRYDFNLCLHLPAPYDLKNNCFIEGNGQYDTGRTANYYHRRFSSKCELDSFSHIKQAIERGAMVTVGKDFKSRNTLVARDSDVLIALTFGQGAKLKDGGTMDTMTKFLKKKNKINSYHIDLHDLKIYNPAEVS